MVSWHRCPQVLWKLRRLRIPMPKRKLACSGFRRLRAFNTGTDVLSYVDVFMYSTSAQSEPKDVPGRTACGSKTPGHYSCSVPLGAALAQLRGGDGIVGLRIEAEGLDGDRSTVRVTLPVKAASKASPPAPSVPGQNNPPTYRHALSFIVDHASDVNRPAVHR